MFAAAGDVPYRMLDAKQIRRRRDKLASRPESANGFLKAMRALFTWAMGAGHMDRKLAESRMPLVRLKEK